MLKIRIANRPWEGEKSDRELALSDDISSAGRIADLFLHHVREQLIRLSEGDILDVPRYVITDECRNGDIYVHIQTRRNDNIFVALYGNPDTGPWNTCYVLSQQPAMMELVKEIPDDVPHRVHPDMPDIRLLDVDYDLKTFKNWIDRWLPAVDS